MRRLKAVSTFAGAYPPREIVAQACAQNSAAIADGRVDLRLNCAERLPFDDGSFDKAMAINSIQVWPDAAAGLREIRRALRSGGRIALGFTPRAGQPRAGLAEALDAASFTDTRIVESNHGFCALATKP